MGTKAVDSYKFMKGVGDIAIGKKSQEYTFEASIYHDQTQSRDNLLSLYKEVLASKEMTPEEKEEYLKLLQENIDEANADMKKTQNDVDDKRRNELLGTALFFSAGLLVYVFCTILDSRRR
ncbi:MAG: hypothetical protein K6F69_10025 [Treponema sp.]|nr:hypothetical protein [Treponema sp.]